MAALPLREDDTGWYLYGVVPNGADPPAVAGVDPRDVVVTLAEGPVAGIVSRVSLSDFDDAALAERLADAQWLEQKIRAHEQVVETALAGGAVVPCRFCTVYRDEHELRRLARQRKGPGGRLPVKIYQFNRRAWSKLVHPHSNGRLLRGVEIETLLQRGSRRN